MRPSPKKSIGPSIFKAIVVEKECFGLLDHLDRIGSEVVKEVVCQDQIGATSRKEDDSGGSAGLSQESAVDDADMVWTDSRVRGEVEDVAIPFLHLHGTVQKGRI